MIYQSGYLTIKGCEPRGMLHTLGYRNEEVQRGFLSFVLPHYSSASRDRSGLHISRFADELEADDVDAFMARLKCFFESIPYDLNDQTERHYPTLPLRRHHPDAELQLSERRYRPNRRVRVYVTRSAVRSRLIAVQETATQPVVQVEREPIGNADGRADSPEEPCVHPSSSASPASASRDQPDSVCTIGSTGDRYSEAKPIRSSSPETAGIESRILIPPWVPFPNRTLRRCQSARARRARSRSGAESRPDSGTPFP